MAAGAGRHGRAAGLLRARRRRGGPMKSLTLIVTALAALAAATPGLGQSPVAAAFTATYALADGNVHLLTDGAVLVFPTIDVNSTSTATIEILNQGTGSGIVSGVTLAGAGFRLGGLPLLPTTAAA